ncbi:L-ribulose-5-phosphate 3-epimerase UlaE [Clostridium sediminicola]|uniref:L-ribulose-5-phosphate 3-epimerase n=1 Tax=Clostridium sediminicola TaxID=3114879 RepID=UPI0031F1F1A1
MTYLLGVYEKSMPNYLSLEEKLKAGKSAGFDFMEISIDETDEKLERLYWSYDDKKELVDAMYKMEMPIKTMCLSGHRKYPLGSNFESTVNKGMEIMRKAIDFASDIGIRIIQIAGYDVYYEESSPETIERFGMNLKESVEYAAKKGVLLGFETMETEFMNTVEKAMRYVEKINSPYLNVYPDIGNITNASKMYNTNVIDDISKGIGKVVAVHLKETIPGIFREVPFGTGHVEFERVIKELRKSGVNMFTGEFWYKENSDWKKELEFACNFLRSKFD